MKTFPTALLLLLLVPGCGQPSGIGKLSGSSVVIAFGDSLTAGTGANPEESYPAVLAKMTGCRVVNAGVPGEETSAALKRLPTVLQKEGKTDLVILCLGGNDMLRKREEKTIRRNLEAMISIICEAGADIILIGVPRPGLLMKAPGFYREIARQSGIPYDTETIPRILTSPSLKSDQIHPNAAGYRQLAEAIAVLIQKHQQP